MSKARASRSGASGWQPYADKVELGRWSWDFATEAEPGFADGEGGAEISAGGHGSFAGD